jgi:predicted Zn-dependent peptidase
MVTNVGGFNAENRGPGAFYVTATLRPASKTDTVESAIYEDIERLKQEPIADWELQKAKSATRRGFLQNIQRSLSTAITVGQYAVYYNEPSLINTRLDKVSAVTKADVQRVANKYLTKENRVVVITTPGGRGAANGMGQ